MRNAAAGRQTNSQALPVVKASDDSERLANKGRATHRGQSLTDAQDKDGQAPQPGEYWRAIDRVIYRVGEDEYEDTGGFTGFSKHFIQSDDIVIDVRRGVTGAFPRLRGKGNFALIEEMEKGNRVLLDLFHLESITSEPAGKNDE